MEKKNTDFHLAYTLQLFPRKHKLVYRLSQSFAIHGALQKQGARGCHENSSLEKLKNIWHGTRLLQRRVKTHVANLSSL